MRRIFMPRPKNIIRSRAEKGWSQAELARQACVSHGVICRMEGGESVSAGTVKKVSETLGKDLEELFTITL